VHQKEKYNPKRGRERPAFKKKTTRATNKPRILKRLTFWMQPLNDFRIGIDGEMRSKEGTPPR